MSLLSLFDQFNVSLMNKIISFLSYLIMYSVLSHSNLTSLCRRRCVCLRWWWFQIRNILRFISGWAEDPGRHTRSSWTTSTWTQTHPGLLILDSVQIHTHTHTHTHTHSCSPAECLMHLPLSLSVCVCVFLREPLRWQSSVESAGQRHTPSFDWQWVSRDCVWNIYCLCVYYLLFLTHCHIKCI